MRLLGIDVTDSAVRAVVCTAAGELVGSGRAAGADLRAAPEDAVHIVATVRHALAGGGVDAVAVGALGAGSRRREEVVATVAVALAQAGVAVAATVVTDLDIAFRAAAPGPSGALLVAGTRAVAARYVDWRLTERCDGLGWILGDEGSGTWLGWQALRAAAADLDGRGPATELTDAVLDAWALDTTQDLRQELVRASDDIRPQDMAALAPMVLRHAADPVAAALLDEATERLAVTAGVVGAAAGTPLVLAGGLLARGPLADRVRRLFPDAAFATHPVVGACAVAADSVGQPLDRAALTAALG